MTSNDDVILYQKEGLREDGRKPDQARTVTINTGRLIGEGSRDCHVIGSIGTAYGSAVVRVGGTCVVCGITAVSN